MTTTYQQRKESRIDYLRSKASKFSTMSDDALESSRAISNLIPFGQPILVGHHSEGRHRRDLQRIDDRMRKCCELADKAKYYERRAKAAESNTSISSDDPEAVKLLTEKLKSLETNHQLMKDANKCMRKGDRDGLRKLGFSEINIEELFRPDFAGRKGFADFRLTNNLAEIKRIKGRIKQLRDNANREPFTFTSKYFTVETDQEANRIRLFFDGKPSPEIRHTLKRNGFRWSRHNLAWQRMNNRNGENAVQWVNDEIARMEGIQ